MDFIANYPRTVKVYQIKNISDVDYAFRDFDEKKFNINDYERVFEKKIEPHFHYTDEDLLEDWFRIFNEYGYPKEYRGRSLSVSDIIVINNKAYYCEPVGWRVISFNFEEEYKI